MHYFTFILAISLTPIPHLDAIGPRGGGGGGGRMGGGRAGRGMNRSPSMSRSARPRSLQRQGPARRSRPSTQPRRRAAPRYPGGGIARQPGRGPGGHRDFAPGRIPDRGPGGRRDFAPGRTPTRSNVQQFLQRAPVSPGLDSGSRPINQRLDQYRQNRPQRSERRGEIGDNLRSNISERYPNRGEWFGENFWRNRSDGPRYNFGDRNPWKWATWGGVTGWMAGRGWREPYYYDYGGYYSNGYDANGYDDDDSYVDDTYGDSSSYTYTGQAPTPTQQTPPAQTYAQQTQEIATATQNGQDSEWMSLGVFALAKDREAIGASNVYLQLALDREGDLAGTYYNTTTDKAYPLEGMVDEQNQLAAWMMSDSQNSPIMQTGIYNLTQNQTPVRVTFADGSTQDMLLIRLQNPSVR